MTVTKLQSWFSSSGDRRYKTIQLSASLSAEPLLIRPSDVGLDDIVTCSNASTLNAASVIPCVVTSDSTSVKVVGITTLPATAGNLTGDYTITITGS